MIIELFARMIITITVLFTLGTNIKSPNPLVMGIILFILLIWIINPLKDISVRLTEFMKGIIGLMWLGATAEYMTGNIILFYAIFIFSIVNLYGTDNLAEHINKRRPIKWQKKKKKKIKKKKRKK